MTINYPNSRSLFFLIAGCLWFSNMIAGCATTQQQPQATTTISPTSVSSPAPSASSVTTRLSEIQQWTTILKGNTVHGLTFSPNGKLLYQDKTLLAEIPVTYVSNGNVKYAQCLIVSDPSPSGRFNIVKGCEEPTDDVGLCWAVFLVDRQAKIAKKVGIAKYGGQDWVQWSSDERYAVFAESMEGVTWFVALDLQSQDAKMFQQTSAVADLSSFKWLDNRTFQANVSCGDRSDCVASPFWGDITKLFSK
ncbi:hypothetical protein [Leptolyngbya sp. FACHB-17]|uniref:hypothetical protein n=1 Tax=unclassified Leptolyngbya TaxID=2650499 RepID=UPI0016817B1A|nr:hypothetical protein [Leptolyngbya sp. FACHB-17]MBD2082505.1 hypothetical protein [Leptolyngbya sp. FACHB-17]